MHRLLALAALAGAACIPDPGPMMKPGSDCMECHGGGGGEEDAVAWTVAGTWSGQGLHVDVHDSAGKSFTLTTNQAGNFYTREPVQFPITVSVEGTWMPPVSGVPGSGGIGLLSPPNNSCGRCHGSGGDGGGGGG